MIKRKLTKSQAELVPELQKTWTVFAGLTPQQQEVMRLWDEELYCLCMGGDLYSNEKIGIDHGLCYRIPADAEWEVIDDEPEFRDVEVSITEGIARASNPNNMMLMDWLSYSPCITGPEWAFVGYVWPDGSLRQYYYEIIGDGSLLTYCKAVRFRRVKPNAGVEGRKPAQKGEA